MEQSALPDLYDRQLANLQGVPDVIKSSSSVVRVVPTLGIGGSQTFHVQTYKHRERGDFIFLEVVEGERAIRLALPPEIAATIARQREALIARARSRRAKAAADDRKRRGVRPGFAKCLECGRSEAKHKALAHPFTWKA